MNIRPSNINPSEKERLLCLICNTEFLDGHKRNAHLKEVHSITYEEYVVKQYFNNNNPICMCGCNTKLKFKQFLNKPFFSDFTKNHFPRKEHTQEAKDKIKQGTIATIRKKYGVDNIMELKEYVDKIAEVKKKRYGDANYNNIEKGRKTNLDRYGSNNYNTSDSAKDKFLENKDKCRLCKKPVKTAGNYYCSRNCLLQDKKDLKFSSVAEREIADLLRSKGLNVIQGSRTMGIEVDILLPDLNIAIEYNGMLYHSEYYGKKPNSYHLNKTKVCESSGIQLIHIFEEEYKKKKQLLLSKILYKCSVGGTIKVHARKCIIREVSSLERNIFLEENHIQGKDKATISLGAYYQDELIGVYSLSKPRVALGRKTSKENEYELSRFATKSGISCNGLLSKMIKYSQKNYIIDSLYTYADRRYTYLHDNAYLRAGFIQESITKPNYWYLKNYDTRIHRFNFTKSKIIKMGGDADKTEIENMIEWGYDRIWDSGSIKYIYNK
jgi:hypothetical protein